MIKRMLSIPFFLYLVHPGQNLRLALLILQKGIPMKKRILYLRPDKFSPTQEREFLIPIFINSYGPQYIIQGW